MDYSFIYLSNKVEILYEALKKSLFYPGANPFAKRLIIVPSPAMKSYLKRKMAEDLKIFFGLEFAFLDQGIELLGGKSKRVPTHFELSLFIESEIDSILKKEAALLIWQPLIAYLTEAKDKKKGMKVSWLADELARLFLIYGEYGQEMILQWEMNTPCDWQAELWRRIFSQKKFSPLFQAFSEDCKTNYQEVHLFGLSFISDAKNQFLMQAAAAIPMYFWFLSPCQKLWSDIHSDKESNAISSFWLNMDAPLQNLENLVQLLRDRNPLLANFGKLGRRMAHMLEEQYPQTFGHYEIAKACSEHPEFESLIGMDIVLKDKDFTLLDAVQADLALLRVPDKPILLNMDSSIQIHASSSILREVENVYQILLRTIHESSEAIEPHQIIVMAPEITDYAPYIHMVFGHKDSQFDYQIMDLKLLSQGELIQAFSDLIALAGSKWKLEEVIKLFSYSFFAKKQELENEDLAEVKKWFGSQNIFWGVNNQHRTEILQKDGFKPLLELSEKGTWQEAIDSLLMGMIYKRSDEKELLEMPLLPIEKIDLSKADILGKFISCLQNLRADLEPLYLGEEKSLPEWAEYFKMLLDKYLEVDFDQDILHSQYQTIIQAISRLQKNGSELAESHFEAASATDRLMSLFENKEYCYREKHFQAVCFSSLLPMRAVPAKIVLLMGMNLDAYPRKEQKSSLDRLVNFPQKNYCPKQIDYDRYLFLEALLSARHSFIISYIAKSTSSASKSSPSTLVSEFLDYLKAFYGFDTVFYHPFNAYDKAYFQIGSPFISYSERNYRAAKAYYGIKSEAPAFVKQFGFPEKIIAFDPVIDIKALAQLAKHPLQSYLNKKLGIYLNPIQENLSEWELSALERYKMKQKGLKQSLELVLASSDKQRKWPYAPFNALAKEAVCQDIQKIEDALAVFSLTRDDIIRCEFSLGCSEAIFKENHLKLPPIEIEMPNGIVKITGSLSSLTPKGLLILDKKELPRAIRNYPESLLFSAIPDGLVEKQFLFVEKEMKISAAEHPKEHLRHFLQYYFLAHTAISPLMPEWVSAILEGSHERLHSAMAKSHNDPFKGYQDPYVQWIFHEEALPEAAILIEKWQPLAKQLFEPLQKMWEL